ncbi:DUF1134 domain-containing protein [Polymorphobacter sp.]|uniref:DUF1134 domain-containing protein n=1 Tax=Polymorphobacter sp. TaxID=1909290 RepID=UPI003F71CAE1
MQRLHGLIARLLIPLTVLLAGGGTPAFAQSNPAAAPPVVAPPPPASYPPPKPVTYAEDDVLGAAEDAFGKGTEGLAESVRRSFASYGQPNAYIVGREAGGAIIFGLRYGSGTLYHAVEGEQKIHWTGPSVGFDIGGSGSKFFALVYNLNDTNDIFRRFPAGEGKAYLIGGVSATYLQRDNIIIVPMKLGVGWRIGLNAGYLKFSREGKLIPF